MVSELHGLEVLEIALMRMTIASRKAKADAA